MFAECLVDDTSTVWKLSVVPGSALQADTGTQRLDIIPGKAVLPFIAFSHVWAQGRESDSQQGLPTCQVAYLHGLCVKAMSIVLKLGEQATACFWIDSLCILAGNLRKTAYPTGRSHIKSTMFSRRGLNSWAVGTECFMRTRKDIYVKALHTFIVEGPTTDDPGNSFDCSSIRSGYVFNRYMLFMTDEYAKLYKLDLSDR
jgi:hypothetical protein